MREATAFIKILKQNNGSMIDFNLYQSSVGRVSK